MSLSFLNKKIVTFCTCILICFTSFANEDLFKQARTLQREGKFDEAIESFKNYLTQPINKYGLLYKRNGHLNKDWETNKTLKTYGYKTHT